MPARTPSLRPREGDRASMRISQYPAASLRCPCVRDLEAASELCDRRSGPDHLCRAAARVRGETRASTSTPSLDARGRSYVIPVLGAREQKRVDASRPEHFARRSQRGAAVEYIVNQKYAVETDLLG